MATKLPKISFLQTTDDFYSICIIQILSFLHKMTIDHNTKDVVFSDMFLFIFRQHDIIFLNHNII